MGFSPLKAAKALLAIFGVRENREIEKVVKTVFAPDGRHRVFIYRRANGAYGWQEELYDDRSIDQRWYPAQEFQPPDCDTQEAAAAAARAAVPWFAALPE